MEAVDQKSASNPHQEGDKKSPCNSTAVEVAPPSIKQDDASIYPKAENPDGLKTEEEKPIKLDDSKEGVKIEGAICAIESVETHNPTLELEIKEEKPTTSKLEFTTPACELPPRGITVSRDDDKTGLSDSFSSSDGSPEDLGGGAQVAETSPLDHTDDVRTTTTDTEGLMSSSPTAVAASDNTEEETRMETPDRENFPSSQIDAPQIIVKEEPMDIDIEPGSIAHEEPRPLKRRRLLMDGVEVPFIAPIRNHANREREAHREVERREIDLENLEQLRNPKVKKPKNLPPPINLDTIRDRLVAQNIPSEPFSIDLPKEILDTTVEREFMSKNYGGNEQETAPPIAAKFWKRTGKRYFLYLNLDYNPHCPEVPGAPGVLFNVGYSPALGIDEDQVSDEEEDDEDEDKNEEGNEANDEISADEGDSSNEDQQGEEDSEEEEKKADIEKPWTLFARLDTKTWQYEGEYVSAPAPVLTLAEWKQQSLQVQNKWTRNIANPKKKWGKDVRIGIGLRRQLGWRPTEREMEAAWKAGKDFAVTPEEISKAIDDGEVVIATETMKCIDYDRPFQRDLAAKMPSFERRTRKPRGGAKKAAGAKGKKAAATKTQSGGKAKRKRTAAPASQSKKRKWADFDSESEEDDEYQPQGTRSRPITVA